MVFEVPPVIVNGGGGWCVPCNDVVGEGNDVAIKRVPFGVGQGEILDAPEDSDVASWLFDDNEEGWPLLSQ